MIFGARSEEYRRTYRTLGADRWNGAYYYALEIEDRIVPRIETDRNWILLNLHGICRDHSVVFIHNNINPELYRWLARFRDLILVCGIPETVEKVAEFGHAVYLPLSIDVPYVESFRRKTHRGTCFAGRIAKIPNLPANVEIISGLPREELLSRLATKRYAYAVGRCALEARALGVEVLPYDPRFPDPDVWQVLDNLEAVPMLQRIIDDADGVS